MTDSTTRRTGIHRLAVLAFASLLLFALAAPAPQAKPGKDKPTIDGPRLTNDSNGGRGLVDDHDHDHTGDDA
ncbi:MAG TPA: hypothetical protein VJ978_05420 [Nitriliruptoraceae bacterium]|nr:hypothetical protein [Nitriliruptoraceae bacterium]